VQFISGDKNVFEWQFDDWDFDENEDDVWDNIWLYWRKLEEAKNAPDEPKPELKIVKRI